MNNEEKQLLLRDLCARLPYDVMVDYNGCIYILNEIDSACKDIDYITVRIQDVERLRCAESALIENIKPYLRSMNSMTEEEKEELKSKCLHTETEEDWEGVRCDVWCIQILERYDTRRRDNPIWPSTINMDAIDWLNSRHFDYRGLIEKGLAIEVTEQNNLNK